MRTTSLLVIFYFISVSHYVIPSSNDLETNEEWTLHVKSRDLKMLFESFRIFDMEPEKKRSLPSNSLLSSKSDDKIQPSFARRLLSAVQCNDIVNEINLLSKGAFVLQKNVSNQADYWTSGSVPVFEVEVVCTQGTLKVNEKVC